VGATVLLGASAVVVDARVDVVGRADVLLAAASVSSSPPQLAIASAPTRTNDVMVRTYAR
jgi:hypothetical protein